MRRRRIDLTASYTKVLIGDNVLPHDGSYDVAPFDGKSTEKAESNSLALFLQVDARHSAQEGSHPDTAHKYLVSGVPNEMHERSKSDNTAPQSEYRSCG